MLCGNGRLDATELCDGDCPDAASCQDGDACTQDILFGSATTCDAHCDNRKLPAKGGDGQCCQPDTNNEDDDCPFMCGNGVVEIKHETCDDSNTVVEDGCDGTCQTETCAALLTGHGPTDCAPCICTNCVTQTAACLNGTDPQANQKCLALVRCAAATGCRSTDCYCGAGVDLLTCASSATGSCKTEVIAAAGSSNPLTISAEFGNKASILGRADAVGSCSTASCQAQCGP